MLGSGGVTRAKDSSPEGSGRSTRAASGGEQGLEGVGVSSTGRCVIGVEAETSRGRGARWGGPRAFWTRFEIREGLGHGLIGEK